MKQQEILYSAGGSAWIEPFWKVDSQNLLELNTWISYNPQIPHKQSL